MSNFAVCTTASLAPLRSARRISRWRLVRHDALDGGRDPFGRARTVVEPGGPVPLRPAPSAAVRLALVQPAADIRPVFDFFLVDDAVLAVQEDHRGDSGAPRARCAAHLGRLHLCAAVVSASVLQVDGERPVVVLLHAAGVDELACPLHGAGHQRLSVGADDEDAVRCGLAPLALTRLGSFGSRARCRALGLAACDRPYRAGARAHGGRPLGP